MRVEKTMKKFTVKAWRQKQVIWRNGKFGLHKSGTFLGYLSGYGLLHTRRTSLSRGCVEFLLLMLDVPGSYIDPPIGCSDRGIPWLYSVTVINCTIITRIRLLFSFFSQINTTSSMLLIDNWSD